MEHSIGKLMMIDTAKTIVVLTVVVLGLGVWPATTGRSSDYQVSQVIVIGPGPAGPLFRPIKWSPDGSKIAYFKGQILMVADTLGDSREILTIDYVARHSEWTSDTTVVFVQREYCNSRPRRFRLSVVSLNGVETILEDESVATSDKPSFSIPRKTPSGVVYYFSDVAGANNLHVLTGTSVKERACLAKHHYVESVDSTLYKISLDGTDTTSAVLGRLKGVVVNNDYRLVMSKAGYDAFSLYDLETPTVDTVVVPELDVPDGVYCGLGTYEFSPVRNLILFSITCDDGHSAYKDVIYLYDYDEKRFVLLSPLTDSRHESSPFFSPNGTYFSFVAGGKGVCIARLEAR
jgi:hypothetical protein